MRHLSWILLTVMVGGSGPLAAQVPQASTADERQEVTITVYNQNFGLVREVRDITLVRGTHELEFRDVASAIEPATVHIRSLTAPGSLRVLEQNYRYDLLSPQQLLEKYVGRTVKVFRCCDKEGRDRELEAEVLSTNGGTLLRIGGEITYGFPGRLAFPEIPENLIAKPTLLWTLDSDRTRQRIEVSYLTGKLNWQADYVLVLSEDNTSGDLNGWVTLTNQSGVAYERARLKLVAGTVRRVGNQPTLRMARDMVAEAARSQFRTEAFFEYHLYTLERPTTLLQNEQKQVSLLEAPSVRVQKQFILTGTPNWYRGRFAERLPNEKVGVYLDLPNTRRNRLGMPLPAGVVRVYKADREGAQQFVGEDRIDHTPRDETLRIKLGEAFDLVAERHQMDYAVMGSCSSESSWEVRLRNHKDENVTIQVLEPVGGDWEVRAASHEWRKMNSTTLRFDVDVPRDGETTIEYRVRVRWC